ncbi:MAG: hypothetical protein ACP5N7_02405 [Candidatus Pacearchaeota archaeon]
MGIFNTLVGKYKDAQKKSADRKEFKILLHNAVSDGKLTEEELKEIESKRSEFGITEQEFNNLKQEMYLVAFNTAKDDKRITPSEEQELEKIQKYFGVTDTSATQKELARYKLLYNIDQGIMPSVQITNVIMRKGEQAYWSEPSSLVEEKVIRRTYQGGSKGMSFRVMKGVSYRVGGSRGHIVSETGMVEVSKGSLIITNKRVIFTGEGKSFTVALDKILDLQIFSNGLYITETNKAKQKMVKFAEEGNHDIVGATLSYAINHFDS